MQTTRYWQVLLQKKIPDIYEYLIEADKIKNENYKLSAVCIRNFLEGLVKLILKYENIIEDDSNIKDGQLFKYINILGSKKILNKDLLNKVHKVREIGNKGSHPEGVVNKEELFESFEYIKEFAEYFTDNYIDKILQIQNRLKAEEIELPELQDNEIYIFECLKPECRREIKEKNNLKICKKCGGPTRFKNIDANYISDETKPVEPYESIPTFRPTTSTSDSSKKTEVIITREPQQLIKKHKIEIYDSSLELINETILNKDNIVVGRSSSTSTPDIDLVDIANDENGNCLISREHVYITKINDEYYIKNASSKALVQLNHQKIEHNQDNIKLVNNDIIILNNFIGLVYRVI